MEVWCQTESTVSKLFGISTSFSHFFGTSFSGTTANRPRMHFTTLMSIFRSPFALTHMALAADVMILKTE